MAYCTNCGVQANGKYCGNCGTPRDQPPSDNSTVDHALGHWEDEHRYDMLLRYPEVRDRIDRSSRRSPKKLTGEEWLGLYDKAFSPIPGISMQKLASIVAPLNAKIGFKTGKKRFDVVDQPIGKMIVAVLCSLAENGLPLLDVHQGEIGCVLEAKLPSDLFAFEGQIVVSIEKSGSGTKIEAATNIPGQWIDWGKSTRCLNKLFGAVAAQAA